MITLIAAASLNGVIGIRAENTMPWGMDEFPEDMAHFRKSTQGATVIMGSRTYDSIGRPLPKRRNVVISRTEDKYEVEKTGVETYPCLHTAIASCQEGEKVFVIGGGNIYQEALPLAGRILLTLIPKTVVGSASNLVTFPFINPRDFDLVDTKALNKDKDLYCYYYERNAVGRKRVTAEEQAEILAMTPPMT